MKAYDLPRVAVIALAKRIEEVFVPGQPDPIVLSRHSAGLQLLQRIRDEAHRFAVGFHRQRREARGFGSIFDDLEGVGPARRRALLNHFGSVERDARRDAGGARGRPRGAARDGAADLRAAAQSGPGIEPRPATGPREALRLIGSRNFGPFFAGNAASATGTWFQNLAAALFVWRLTHSAFLLGVLAFSNFIPVLLLVPWTGSAADRFNRKKLLLATQIAAFALTGTLALLTWAGLARVWLVMVFAVGLGVATAFATPAAFSLIGGLVPREELGSAVALNSMTYNVARAVGPLLAAVTVAQLGIAAAFAVNSASYLALVVGVLVVHPAARRARRTRGLPAAGEPEGGPARPALLASLLIVTAVGFASDPVNTWLRLSRMRSASRTRRRASSSARSARARWRRRSCLRGA